MHVAFVEKMAEHTMVHRRISRNTAKLRHALIWGALGLVCLAAWAATTIAPSAVPVLVSAAQIETLLLAGAAIGLGLSLLFFLCREPD